MICEVLQTTIENLCRAVLRPTIRLMGSKSSPLYICEPEVVAINKELPKIQALGTLCAFFILQTGLEPEPVSPVLLRAAIDGVDSALSDVDWLSTVQPEIWRALSLLPDSPPATTGTYSPPTGQERR